MEIKEKVKVRQLIKNEKIYDYKIIKLSSRNSIGIISSTYIRSLLERGNLKKTNKLEIEIGQ